MTFAASTKPDISEDLPFLLSAATSTTRIANKGGVRFDYQIGGVGFRSACNDQRQYLRQSAQVQKDQFDASREAGEQTLSQYWIRSQTSWHLGSGIVNYEPGADQTTQHRFAESLGVDVWKEGDVTLLKKTSVTQAATAGQVSYATGAIVSGLDTAFTNVNGTVRRDTTAYTGVTDALTPVVVAGAKVLVGRASSIAYGDSTGTLLADLWTGAPAAPKPYWAKSRIIASTTNQLWELTLTGGAWPATSLYAHPDSGWVWSDVAEAPSAILASGYSNGRSAIYRFSLEDAGSGATPKLSQAYQVAEFPLGEVVYALHVYLGRYIGIGTSKGIRIGIVSDAGEVQYGPLLVETAAPVRDLAAGNRFMYAAVTTSHPDGRSGAVRVDLQAEIGQGTLRFPYAWDARTGTSGRVDSIALLGASDRVVLGVIGEGVYTQSSSDYETSGYVQSGRIRFSTVESKAFRLIDVAATLPSGGLTVESVERDGDRYVLGSLSPAAADGRGIAINQPSGTFDALSFRFTLTRDNAYPYLTPTLEGMQVKAIPAPRRQRLIEIPLLCMDKEDDRNGVAYGYEGFALERLQALEEMEDSSVVVAFVDNTTGEAFDGVIEKQTFSRATPGDPALSNQGYIQLVLRKL